MKPAIVKLTVDLYCPGAVLRQKETNWLFNWEKFHSRRILYPTMEPGMLTTVEDGVQIVVQDFCHIRLTAIDDGYWGILDSRLDGGLAGEGVELTLGEEIARISQVALMKAPPFRFHRTHAAWLELWDGNRYISDVSLKDIVEMCMRKA